MIEEQIFSILTADSGLSAIVDSRIYPMSIPQEGRTPCIVYQKITGPRLYDHGGESGLAYPRFQFSCWANSYSGAKALADALRSAFSAYSDRSATVPVHVAFIEAELDDYEPETKLYRRIMDFRVWHEES